MKSKISVTLTDDLVRGIEEHVKEFKSRSDLIEEAVQRFLTHLERKEAEERDIEIINRRADFLNAEAEDFLELQETL
ncbi:MAG: ribbon-helix-helix domain-containing protein [Armatimonadetes bacterium]|nr:ribbon-helix-helix domain-containing protein [Armatimonadota bacterium]